MCEVLTSVTSNGSNFKGLLFVNLRNSCCATNVRDKAKSKALCRGPGLHQDRKCWRSPPPTAALRGIPNTTHIPQMRKRSLRDERRLARGPLQDPCSKPVLRAPAQRHWPLRKCPISAGGLLGPICFRLYFIC